jgi:hypothetical protein
MNKPSWRCNHCHGSLRRKIRVRRRDRDVYAEVRAYVLALVADPKLKPYGFTKEDLSVTLQVKEHNVERALARLNQEGLVNQPAHRYPHDCNRSTRMDGGSDSSWIGDVYTVRR